MSIREKVDTIESFITGFGNKNSIDINNAVFVAKEMVDLNIRLDYRGAGRHGVMSLELYVILEGIKLNIKKQEAFRIGKTFSEYDSRELMLMTSYLWNEGRSSLYENEREEALILLQGKFGVTTEKSAKLSSVAASG